jgi:hypothetical protein
MEGAVLAWPLPERLRFKGRTVELEPMSEDHVSELWTAARDAAALLGERDLALHIQRAVAIAYLLGQRASDCVGSGGTKPPACSA